MNKIELTQIEKDCQLVLARVIDWLSPGRRKVPSTVKEWTALLAAAGDAKQRLDRKENGCPMGLHWNPCTCKENAAGENLQAFKLKMRKMIQMNKRKGFK